MNELKDRFIFYSILIIALMAVWIPRLDNQEYNKLIEMRSMRDLEPVRHSWHESYEVKNINTSTLFINPLCIDKSLKVNYPLSVITGDVQIDGKVWLRGYEIIPQIPSEPKKFMPINPRDFNK